MPYKAIQDFEAGEIVEYKAEGVVTSVIILEKHIYKRPLMRAARDGKTEQNILEVKLRALNQSTVSPTHHFFLDPGTEWTCDIDIDETTSHYLCWRLYPYGTYLRVLEPQQ